MSKKITIDPITRLEGHGKIDIFLDDAGKVTRAFLSVPELRGFEKFAEGRPAEEMPQLTSRICGVCPGAHHIASSKALDALFGVQPPPAARAIREMYYHLHTYEDHILHFFILAGPDFIVGPAADPARRNILGVIDRVGVEVGKQVIATRKKARDFIDLIAGKAIHPVFGLPGGVSKPIEESTREHLREFSVEAIEFARFSLQTFDKLVLQNEGYLDLIRSDTFRHETYYMGLVDEKNRLNLYDGDVRVVDPSGREVMKFRPEEYSQVIGEHVESWSYIKFPFLKKIGWKGFRDGADSGIYRVAPIARMNVSSGFSTPLAREEAEKMFDALGEKPCHNTLAIHWARLIEILYCAEKIGELAAAPELTDRRIRNMDLQTPREGVGIVEAPRGTLIHHYKSDERGILTGCNLIVASLGNSAAMCLSIEKAARDLIVNGHPAEGLLNMVEMAFRAYDPCLGCATHSLPGKTPLRITMRGAGGEKLGVLVRDEGGWESYRPSGSEE